MYWFWYFLFCAQPQFLLLGLFGLLGKEAEKAANDVGMVMGVVLIIVLVLAGIYLGLQAVGVL